MAPNSHAVQHECSLRVKSVVGASSRKATSSNETWHGLNINMPLPVIILKYSVSMSDTMQLSATNFSNRLLLLMVCSCCCLEVSVCDQFLMMIRCTRADMNPEIT